MSWFIRVSRYLSVHMIYAQEMPNSCGMASIMMVNFKQKRDTMMTGLAAGAQLNNLPLVGPAAGQALMKAAIDYAVKSEPEVYKEYTKVTGSPYDGSGYSDCLFFPKVLKNLGLGEWEAVYVGPTGFSAAAKAATAKAPIICQVRWANGAHFVVIDEYHFGDGMVNDPGDGELHVTSMTDGNAVTYTPSEPLFSFSLGGKRGSYGPGQTGTFSGWIVRKK